jgi:hypothetical protein
MFVHLEKYFLITGCELLQYSNFNIPEFHLISMILQANMPVSDSSKLREAIKFTFVKHVEPLLRPALKLYDFFTVLPVLDDGAI